MMGGQHTTYDSITTTTTKEAEVTGMLPLVQQEEEHETGGTLIEDGEVGATPEDRRRILVRRSMIQTRSVAAILVGAAVLLVALTTMDFGGGIGSVGSLVSVRSSSRTANEFDGTIAPTDQYGFPPEDYDYDSGYDDVLDLD